MKNQKKETTGTPKNSHAEDEERQPKRNRNKTRHKQKENKLANGAAAKRMKQMRNQV